MNAVYTCMIVEDEPPAMQLLEDYIQKLPMLHLKGKYFDALEALDAMKKEPVDVIFLDINLPSLSGLDMAALIPRTQKIIFTTAYAAHALESFAFHVVDYLLKPISFKRFLEAIQKLQSYAVPPLPPGPVSESHEFLFIKTGRKVVKIEYSDILYIAAHKEYLCIHTPIQKYLVYKRMKEMAASLPASFVRIHNSYIVNLTKINKANHLHVMVEGQELPVSNGYKEALLQKLNRHLL